MMLPKFDYAEPKTLRRACHLLEDDAAIAIAGGTDLLQALKNRLKTPRVLVDLTSIPRLARISYSNKTGLKLGALVTLRELARNTVVAEKYPLLAQAVRQVGSPQLQAMGTVGGNLCQDTMCLFYNRPPMTRQMLAPCYKLGGRVCHAVSGSADCWAVYCGDLAPVLMTLDARVKLVRATGQATGSRGNAQQSRPFTAFRAGTSSAESELREEIIPVHKLFSGDGLRPNILKSGQILTEILLPPPAPRSGGAYLKLRMRQTIDYPLLGVAVHLSLEVTPQVSLRAKRSNRGSKSETPALACGASVASQTALAMTQQENWICKDARVALSGVDQAPLLISQARQLKGKRIGDAEIAELAHAAHKQARPLGNVSELTPKYRREMIDVYVRRAFQEALERAS